MPNPFQPAAALLQSAVQHHQMGNLHMAEQLYSEVLASRPEDAAALYGMGCLAHAAGNPHLAADFIARAVKKNARNGYWYFSYGEALRACGRIADAIQAYRKATRLKPDLRVAHSNLGVALQQQGRLDEALTSLQRAYQFDRNDPAGLYNLGSVLQQQGRLEEAGKYYSKVLAIDPAHFGAANNLGTLLMSLNKHAEAAATLQRALEIDSSVPMVWDNLSMALLQDARPDEAEKTGREALLRWGRTGERLANLGKILGGQSRFQEAEACFREAISLDPDCLDFYLSLGKNLRGQFRFSEAIGVLREVLEGRCTQCLPIDSHGQDSRVHERPSEIGGASKGGIAIRPGCAAIWVDLGELYANVGRVDEALETLGVGLRVDPATLTPQDMESLTKSVQNFLFFLNYKIGTYSDVNAGEYRVAASRLSVLLRGAARGRSRAKPGHTRLRVGYVSGDLKRHSVSCFIEPLLRCHDHEKFEVYCYANVSRPDGVTEQLKGWVQHWHDIYSRTHAQVVEQIRNDQIDILVDLSGHTSGNRLSVFAARAAPLQVTWLGYPNTTGLEAMDYRLTDAIADPEGPSDGFCTEKLLRLPSFLCYQPLTANIPVSDSPIVASGGITFGSFNSLAKVSDHTLDLWANILQAVPGSRLILKAKGFMDPTVRAWHELRFRDRGVERERLELLPWADSDEGHLEAYQRIDIALDTYPYNGTTTTLEALWMGVPVVTLAGQVHASRVGQSILTHCGLAEMAAQSPEDYVQIAVNLSRDVERLKALRASMRQRLAASPLMDAQAFARSVEAAYQQVWQGMR